MKIPIGVAGAVLNSKHPGHRVRVADDTENTGGFLIFEWWDGSDGPNENRAFDSWVESREVLEAYFIEAGWEVEWEASTPARPRP